MGWYCQLHWPKRDCADTSFGAGAYQSWGWGHHWSSSWGPGQNCTWTSPHLINQTPHTLFGSFWYKWEVSSEVLNTCWVGQVTKPNTAITNMAPVHMNQMMRFKVSFSCQAWWTSCHFIHPNHFRKGDRIHQVSSQHNRTHHLLANVFLTTSVILPSTFSPGSISLGMCPSLSAAWNIFLEGAYNSGSYTTGAGITMLSSIFIVLIFLGNGGCGSATPNSMCLMVPLCRVEGACIGLTGCCTTMILSSLLGCAWVVIAFPEKRPLMNGLIEPAPSMASVPVPRPAPAADGEAVVDAVEVPRRRATKSRFSTSRLHSKNPSDKYVTGPLKWLTINVANPDWSIAPSLNDEWFPHLFPNASVIEWSVFLCDQWTWSSMICMSLPGLCWRRQIYSELSK